MSLGELEKLLGQSPLTQGSTERVIDKTIKQGAVLAEVGSAI